MLRTFPALLLLLLVGVSSAQAATKRIDVEITGVHTVVWDYKEKGYPEECRSWSWGQGTQEIKLRTIKPKPMFVETLLRKPALTGFLDDRGTFGMTLQRVGKWKENAVPMTAKCWPCGPSSEFGPCDEDKPPRVLSFQCGYVKPVRPRAHLGYAQTRLVPTIRTGLEVKMELARQEYFKNCPPTMQSIDRYRTLRNEWPEALKLPKQDTNLIPDLERGESLDAKVRQERWYVDQGGATTQGTSCIQMPVLVDGYAECAVTEYVVTFTRVR